MLWLKKFFAKKVKSDDLSQDDTIIIVMGPTGSGKSSFIEKVTGIKGAVNDNLRPENAKISVTKLSISGFDIHFVDTPGFDSRDETEAAVFDTISDWTAKTCKRKVQVAGLLYFHRITDKRMGSSALRHLRAFKDLCGDVNRIVLTTTMWDIVDQRAGNYREEELKGRFWKPMLERGSTVKRFHRTRASAFDVLAPIFNERQAMLQKQLSDNLGAKERGRVEKLVQFYENLPNNGNSSASSQPTKQTHIHRDEHNEKPRLTQGDVPPHPGSMENPRRSGDERLQSLSMMLASPEQVKHTLGSQPGQNIQGSDRARRPQPNHDERAKKPSKPDNLKGNPLHHKNPR